MPRTVALSGEIFQAAGVAGRVTTVGQSFFDPLPAGADVYLLKKVLDNWPDREATEILSRCAQAARPGGRVVVLVAVVPDSAPIPLSIDMLLVGGKHRTLAEFGVTCLEAGLHVLSAAASHRVTSSSNVVRVEALPLNAAARLWEGEPLRITQGRLAPTFFDERCGVPGRIGQFKQGNDFDTVVKCVASITRIDHDQSIKLEVLKGDAHRRRQGGRIGALAFDTDAAAVLLAADASARSGVDNAPDSAGLPDRSN